MKFLKLKDETGEVYLNPESIILIRENRSPTRTSNPETEIFINGPGIGWSQKAYYPGSPEKLMKEIDDLEKK